MAEHNILLDIGNNDKGRLTIGIFCSDCNAGIGEYAKFPIKE